MIKWVFAMLSIGLLSVGAMAATMDFTEKVTKVGVTLDEEYYVVTFKDGKLTKIELDSAEETDLQVKTTSGQVWYFIQNQGQMTELEKVTYITQNFDIPADLVMEIAGEYMSYGK